MTLKDRWQAEETKLGKVAKYWVGYGATVVGVLIEIGDKAITLFAQYSVGTPEWLTHGLVGLGLLAYIGGKLTVKPASAQ